MEEEQCAAERAREAKAAAAKEAQESARREADANREAQLRAHRERRCSAEQMCQGLPSHIMPWEESAAELLDLLAAPAAGAMYEKWLGTHKTRKAARKQYLLLARKWHPDKWALQGDSCV